MPIPVLSKKQCLFLPVFLYLLQGCGQKQESSQKPSVTENKKDTVTAQAPAASPPAKAPELKISYSLLPLKGNDSNRKAFMKRYEGAARTTVLSLNRIDEKHLSNIDSLVIPDTIISDFMAYSPYPAYVSQLKDVNKIVFFSYSIQAFAVYESGKLVKWGPTSMGSKIHPTPRGLHFTNWKSKRAISTVKSEWILNWNFNIQNQMGVGWHEYALPGYPASHSCLRLLASDAEWLYSWADQWILKDNRNLLAKGTPVIVFGDYPFGSRRPWRNLAADPDANRITEEALNKELEPVLEQIIQAQQQRASVTAASQPAKTEANNREPANSI